MADQLIGPSLKPFKHSGVCIADDERVADLLGPALHGFAGENAGDCVDDPFRYIGCFTDMASIELHRSEIAIFGESAVHPSLMRFDEIAAAPASQSAIGLCIE